ncbi:hypothetical protein CYMTET_49268 [Cymbomonas tetramitiformis]|uniref:Uncharacterized protein n=1 Tax=Cymbomonas tetramitiformis TaxID=36881 RepID=A0AAE0EUQ0_9CHLO|nr:hypothetical protein CYMTET_49268 [Cymbomonas tetramitiformis]
MTESTRKQKILELIDPTFYAASHAEQGEAVLGAGALAAAYSGDDKRIVERGAGDDYCAPREDRGCAQVYDPGWGLDRSAEESAG